MRLFVSESMSKEELEGKEQGKILGGKDWLKIDIYAHLYKEKNIA